MTLHRERPERVQRLTVLYDARCRLCLNARRWIERQRRLVPIEFVAAGSATARERFPDLDVSETLKELTVVSDLGHVYRGAKAWVVCLWALDGYRGWALTLSRPAVLPAARRFVTSVSKNRYRFGRRPEASVECESCTTKPAKQPRASERAD